tara:strand:+ start:285 stop:797 length:513 start_codon:yes stop_codon:yes gene_type:complete
MKISIIVFTIFFSFNLFAHDYHLTHTTLYYNANTEQVEITIKVAIEDLERALEGRLKEKLKIGTADENEKTNYFIVNYFNNHLKIISNNLPVSYTWVGKEVSDNLHDMYLYFEINSFNQHDGSILLKLENTVFFDTALDQSNIVLINFNGDQKNLIFTKDQKTQSVVIAQ